MTIAHPELEGLGNYEYGWSDKSEAGTNARRGISEEVVRDISAKKSEPQWMLDLRLKGLSLFEKKPMPNCGSDFFAEISRTTSSLIPRRALVPASLLSDQPYS